MTCIDYSIPLTLFLSCILWLFTCIYLRPVGSPSIIESIPFVLRILAPASQVFASCRVPHRIQAERQALSPPPSPVSHVSCIELAILAPSLRSSRYTRLRGILRTIAVAPGHLHVAFEMLLLVVGEAGSDGVRCPESGGVVMLSSVSA